MKYTMQQIPEGEDEIIVKYRRMTPEIRRIADFLRGEETKIIGQRERGTEGKGTQEKTKEKAREKVRIILDREQILYIETVDGRTYAYTEEDVIQLDYTLAQLSELLSSVNFFRCSKSMIINIDKVRTLKSLSSNRIDAAMCNGEHIMISRTYASDFRKRLKRGREDE